MRDPKDITINGKQLSAILESHKKWLLSRGGEMADLRGANPREADLREANLRGANPREADLREANLRGADLYGADLRGANLRGADLREANLRGANLYGADLRGADLRGAKNIEMADALTRIVPEGEIIGWKRCIEGVVRLLIPLAAKRSNATGRKCRAEWAIDLQHFTLDGKETSAVFHGMYNRMEYRVGQEVRADKWDDVRWNECSGGIHFFITRYEAEHYEG